MFETMRDSVYSCPDTTMLDACSVSIERRRRAAGSDTLTIEQLRSLAADVSPIVRERIGRRADCPADVQMRLLRDLACRIGVVQTPELLQPETERWLCASTTRDELLLLRMLSAEPLRTETLEVLLNRDDTVDWPNLICRILELPAAVVEQLSSDPRLSKASVVNLVGQKHASRAVLERLLQRAQAASQGDYLDAVAIILSRVDAPWTRPLVRECMHRGTVADWTAAVRSSQITARELGVILDSCRGTTLDELHQDAARHPRLSESQITRLIAETLSYVGAALDPDQMPHTSSHGRRSLAALIVNPRVDPRRLWPALAMMDAVGVLELLLRAGVSSSDPTRRAQLADLRRALPLDPQRRVQCYVRLVDGRIWSFANQMTAPLALEGDGMAAVPELVELLHDPTFAASFGDDLAHSLSNLHHRNPTRVALLLPGPWLERACEITAALDEAASFSPDCPPEVLLRLLRNAERDPEAPRPHPFDYTQTTDRVLRHPNLPVGRYVDELFADETDNPRGVRFAAAALVCRRYSPELAARLEPLMPATAIVRHERVVARLSHPAALAADDFCWDEITEIDTAELRFIAASRSDLPATVARQWIRRISAEGGLPTHAGQNLLKELVAHQTSPYVLLDAITAAASGRDMLLQLLLEHGAWRRPVALGSLTDEERRHHLAFVQLVCDDLCYRHPSRRPRWLRDADRALKRRETDAEESAYTPVALSGLLGR